MILLMSRLLPIFFFCGMIVNAYHENETASGLFAIALALHHVAERLGKITDAYNNANNP